MTPAQIIARYVDGLTLACLNLPSARQCSTPSGRWAGTVSTAMEADRCAVDFSRMPHCAARIHRGWCSQFMAAQTGLPADNALAAGTS